MTKKERDEKCTCDYEDENFTDCDICLMYIDQYAEEHEERKNKRMFEAQEW